MSVDNLTALNARDDLLWIVDHWPALRARLHPGWGNAMNGLPTGSDVSLPIDLHVSDLMFEIEQDVARFYGRILAEETDWTPSTSSMPGLLRDVAKRYGHFVAQDARWALAFCDDAADYRDKVRHAIERPMPPMYVGPCQTKDCAGELYVRPGRDGGTCRECGKEFTLAEQREFLNAALMERLMTASEITSALMVLGLRVPFSTVRSWINRNRLVEAVDGLYRLADALDLASASGGRIGA